ncbi:MAG: hypothetical protein EOP84_01710 [Verrucomicrobiaceae bacterium]|nr:MAG: hypothetical protein EOP84_01710 [Verrucomicrobiaceae bacterium]
MLHPICDICEVPARKDVPTHIGWACPVCGSNGFTRSLSWLSPEFREKVNRNGENFFFWRMRDRFHKPGALAPPEPVRVKPKPPRKPNLFWIRARRTSTRR